MSALVVRFKLVFKKKEMRIEIKTEDHIFKEMLPYIDLDKTKVNI